MYIKPTLLKLIVAIVRFGYHAESWKDTHKTTIGNIEAELFSDDEHNTVSNFVVLTNKGYYDGILFHRVIPGFMIQTGDPTGTGRGGPNTNGGQFFITLAATSSLDGKHSVFGQVAQGMQVVEAIAGVARDGRDKPLSPIAMNKVVVFD